MTSTTSSATPRRLKTWSIAGETRRKPSEYEVVTGKFHYHFNRKPAPFDLDPNAPINQWYLKYREGSALQAPDWEGFRDPATLNYRRYIALQHDREVYAEGVVDRYESQDLDTGLGQAWVETFARLYTPARYLFHVLQLSSLYVGQLAPSAYITNAAFFQAADELRALQWVGYRSKSLSLTHGTHLANTEATRQIWEDDPVWQPAREALEKLLIAYDWGESFVALNLVLKPALDALYKEVFAQLAIDHGDQLTAALLQESKVDTVRNQDWHVGLARYALRANPDNRAVVDGWIDKWRPLADRAVEGLANAFPEPAGATAQVAASVAAFTGKWRTDG